MKIGHLVGFVVALRPLEGLSGITDGRLGPTRQLEGSEPIFRHFLSFSVFLGGELWSRAGSRIISTFALQSLLSLLSGWKFRMDHPKISNLNISTNG